MDKEKYLFDQFENIGIELSDFQVNQFLKFYDFLIETNKKFNLTRITEFEDVVARHFIDSCYVTKYHDFSRVTSLVDVGTGGGFPGIPLKILFPKLNVVLIDSLRKRINFLEEAAGIICAENIRLLHGRAEDFGRNKEFREKFDLCVSRAVSNLSTLSELCLPFVKVGGTFVSYKGIDVEEETEGASNAINLLGGKLERIEKFVVGGRGNPGESADEIRRSLVFVKKTSSTKGKYPRKAGTPLREPL